MRDGAVCKRFLPKFASTYCWWMVLPSLGNGAVTLAFTPGYDPSPHRFLSLMTRSPPTSKSVSTVEPWLSSASTSRRRFIHASLSSSSSPSIENDIDSTNSWDEPESTAGFEEDEENIEIGGVEINTGDSALQEEYRDWSKALKNALTKLEKKQMSLEFEWEKAQSVEKMVSRAQLIVSNLYLFPQSSYKGSPQSVTVQDWENDGIDVELTLNPKYDSASAEADALFAQVRKLKRGSQIVEGLLEQSKSALSALQEAKLDLESAAEDQGSGISVDAGRFSLVKERLTRSARATNFQIPSDDQDSGKGRGKTSVKGSAASEKKRKPELGTPASNIRKLMTPAGCTILVGRNRRGNEHLSLNLARQDDIWMHSRGCPGAHVVLQNRRGGPTPTDDCLQLAADLAIFYSDLRTEAKAEVSAAEPKHLLKPRGAPLGAIKVREEWKTFVGRPDRVPEELKEARDGSGQSDEYRQENKAKHRRRNKQAAEEDSAKRRKRK